MACAVVQRMNLNSEVFVGFNIERKCGIIGGTHYGGEMKKGIFAMVRCRGCRAQAARLAWGARS